MANPFYTPEMQPGADRLNQVSRNLAQIQSVINNRDLGQQRNAIQQQNTDLTKQYYADIAQQARAKTPPDQLPLTPVEGTRARAMLKRATGLGSSVDNFFDAHVNPIAEDTTMSRGHLYDSLSSKGKESVTELLNNVSAEHEKKLLNDPNYAKTPQAKRTEEFMNTLYNSPDMSSFANILMPDVARYRKFQDANSKAAVAEQQSQARQLLQEIKNKGWQQNIEQKIQAQKEINDAKLAMQEKLNDARISSRENIDGQKTGKTKEPTPMDIKHVDDMINNATGGGKKEPNQSSIELIRKTVAPWGYDYQSITRTVPGTIYGTNEEKTWQLVPKNQEAATGLDSEAGLSGHLKSQGASDAYIKDYIKRARAAGKIK